jgi:hypothetical protein
MTPPWEPVPRPRAWLIVLRYVLLIATMALALGAYLLLCTTWSSILGALYAGASGVAAAYRRSLFEKLVFVAGGIVAVAGIIVCDWYYGLAPAARDLFRRFSRVCSLIGLLLSTCHLVRWLLAGRVVTSTILLAGGEFLLAVALLVVARVLRRQA